MAQQGEPPAPPSSIVKRYSGKVQGTPPNKKGLAFFLEIISMNVFRPMCTIEKHISQKWFSGNNIFGESVLDDNNHQFNHPKVVPECVHPSVQNWALWWPRLRVWAAGKGSIVLKRVLVLLMYNEKRDDTASIGTNCPGKLFRVFMTRFSEILWRVR